MYLFEVTLETLRHGACDCGCGVQEQWNPPVKFEIRSENTPRVIHRETKDGQWEEIDCGDDTWLVFGTQPVDRVLIKDVTFGDWQ